MTTTYQVRHGDLLVEEGVLPVDAVVLPTPCLALGSATGHSHEVHSIGASNRLYRVMVREGGRVVRDESGALKFETLTDRQTADRFGLLQTDCVDPTVYEAGGDRWFTSTGNILLVHLKGSSDGEHAAIAIPPGTYLVQRQREHVQAAPPRTMED